MKPQFGCLWKCSVCGVPVRVVAPTGNALDHVRPVRHRNKATGEICDGYFAEAEIINEESTR